MIPCESSPVNATRRWLPFSLVPSRRFLDGFRGTFSPPSRQIRCTRLRFTRSPSHRIALLDCQQKRQQNRNEGAGALTHD